MSDCEIPDFYSHHEPVARKAHKCCECSAPIEKGEKHFFVSMKYEGTIESFRQHLDCMAACMEARDVQDGECIYYGGLKDWWASDVYVQRDLDFKKFREIFARIRRRERAAKKKSLDQTAKPLVKAS